MLLSKLSTKIVFIKRYFSHRNVQPLFERGLFQDIFPDNAQSKICAKFNSRSQKIYAGFDPTADSLHVGNLLVIIGLLHFQRFGHQPIALIGGATGLIGDPSGRNTERNQMIDSKVSDNLTNIEKQLKRIFENHEKLFCKSETQINELKKIKVVNNADWYEKLNVINFISNMGRHFRMGSMLSRSSVQSRLTSSEGMSFKEFTYQIFQAYDWLHLYQTYNCRFQIGGSDQMGNLMTGHELISRVDNKSVFGLTMPIVSNEEGDKFGKSAGNAIWLDSMKTAPFSFYQFFVRQPDSAVEKLLKLFTFLSIDEINEILVEHKFRPDKRLAQRILAENVTLLVHDESGLKQAETVTNALYSGSVEGLGELNINDIQQTFSGAVICEVLPEIGLTAINLAMKAKCFPTESDASRIISAGGFYINQKRSQNISEIISPNIHCLKNGLTLLRVGKKNYYIIKWIA